VLVSVELIAEEIENPFGTDDNDLPLDDLCATIQRDAEALIGPTHP
jgi:putative membrane protein